jgi:hypothetical protein
MNANEPVCEAERLAYLNIVFSRKGVAEYDGIRCVVFIPQEKIQRIESKRGSRAEQPFAQGIAGCILVALGILGLRLLLVGGMALLRWECGFLVFGGIGLWLLWEVLGQGNYLLVIGSEGVRKLVFNGKVSKQELEDFLKNAARLGYICN